MSILLDDVARAAHTRGLPHDFTQQSGVSESRHHCVQTAVPDLPVVLICKITVKSLLNCFIMVLTLAKYA